MSHIKLESQIRLEFVSDSWICQIMLEYVKKKKNKNVRQKTLTSEMVEFFFIKILYFIRYVETL